MGNILSSKDIGEKIRPLCKHAGLSQEQLPELVGVSFQQIQKNENGNTTLNIIKLQQIADSLKLQITDLFDLAP